MWWEGRGFAEIAAKGHNSMRPQPRNSAFSSPLSMSRAAALSFLVAVVDDDAVEAFVDTDKFALKVWIRCRAWSSSYAVRPCRESLRLLSIL